MSDAGKVVFESVDRACGAAGAAWRAMNPFARSRVSDEARAAGMERLAEALQARRAEILKTAVEETALFEAELAPEFDRMTGTLKMLAAAARSGAWRRSAHDGAAGTGQAIGPGHDVRVELVALGPVAVFGASNFPLAYGVCGGDTASALAAGCPVVVKEHPAHPRTGRLIAGTAGEALKAAGLPEGVFGYVKNEDPAALSVARELVKHPSVRGVGFTGSEKGGMAIDRLARERVVDGETDPIPVFAEMGSANPVLVTPGAMAARGAAIGGQIAQSILLRFGQQCTCPGLIVVSSGAGLAELMEAMRSVFEAAGARRMLAPWVKAGYEARVGAVSGIGGVSVAARGEQAAVGDAREAQAVLLRASGETFAGNPTMREEIFGPAAIVVELGAWAEHERLRLRGSLTLTVHAEEADAEDAERARGVVETHADIAGRVIWNGVPTGVRACEAMVHGGPYPATNRPDSTACGVRALERWCRPVCWQNWPSELR